MVALALDHEIAPEVPAHALEGLSAGEVNAPAVAPALAPEGRQQATVAVEADEIRRHVGHRLALDPVVERVVLFGRLAQELQDPAVARGVEDGVEPLLFCLPEDRERALGARLSLSALVPRADLGLVGGVVLVVNVVVHWIAGPRSRALEVDGEHGLTSLEPVAVPELAVGDARLPVAARAPGAVEIAKGTLAPVPGDLQVDGGHLRIAGDHQIGHGAAADAHELARADDRLAAGRRTPFDGHDHALRVHASAALSAVAHLPGFALLALALALFAEGLVGLQRLGLGR